MKIVNIIGGLGNQLFQYAFALGLKCEYPDEEIKINTLCFRGYPLHNGFELSNIIPELLPYASLIDLAKVAYPWCHYRLWQIGTHFLPNRKGMIHSKNILDKFSYDKIKNKSYFDGYWQSPIFFEKYKKEIIETIKFPKITDSPNIEALKYIDKGKTAFIHIRRGDYEGHPLFGGICTLEYYRDAIEVANHEFEQYLLFSNDLIWTKENILPLVEDRPIMLVDWNRGNSSFRDIQLMSKCNGGIIANSSFSWWGAWLSGSNRIIAPAKWCNDKTKHKHILPSNWIKIRNA